MKNDRVSKLFSANLDRLYAAAKEKHGVEAEEALTDAVRKTAGKYGLYVDLLGVITQASSMQCGYMRLQLK